MTTQAAHPRHWQRLGLRGRVALALAVMAVSGIAWDFFRKRPDHWPVRSSFILPLQTSPLGFGPEGRTFLTVGNGGLIPWDSATGRYGARWGIKDVWWASDGVCSPDGRTYAVKLAEHNQSSAIRLLEAPTGRTTATLRLRHPQIYQMTFADGGRTLRTLIGDGAAVKEEATWDTGTGGLISARPLATPTAGNHLAFSPDGKLLASIATWATVVQLRDLVTDRPLGPLVDPSLTGVIGPGLDFSPDGRMLAVARAGGFVDLWDVAARKVSRTLTMHPRSYTSRNLRFAPDGRTLASNGLEDSGLGSTTLQVYSDLRRTLGWSRLGPRTELVVMDLATGLLIARGSSFHVPFYSPDGRSIATTGDAPDQLGVMVRIRDLPAVEHRP